MDDLLLRPATRDDDAGVRRLLAVSFPDNPKRSAAITAWQYWDNPFGQTRSWVWERSGEIVSHWAAVRVPMLLDGKPVAGAKGVDIATHPRYRGQGLFAALSRELVADLHAHGVQALLTHPNPRSFRGVEAAGAALIGCARVHVQALDSLWLGRRLRIPSVAARAVAAVVWPRRSRGQPAQEVEGAPSDLADLSAALPDQLHGIPRTAAWFQWRYAQRPDSAYRWFAVRDGGALKGLAVTRMRQIAGGMLQHVLELVAIDESAAMRLVAGAAAAVDPGDGIALAALPGTRLAALASTSGLRRLPRALEPSPLRVMVIDPAGSSSALAGRHWSFSWGDLDHF